MPSPGKQRNNRGRIILRIELAVIAVEQPDTCRVTLAMALADGAPPAVLRPLRIVSSFDLSSHATLRCQVGLCRTSCQMMMAHLASAIIPWNAAPASAAMAPSARSATLKRHLDDLNGNCEEFADRAPDVRFHVRRIGDVMTIIVAAAVSTGL